MDDDEAIARESLDHLVDHALAAEEDRPFIRLERPQTRIGLRAAARRRVGATIMALASTCCGRAASSHSRNSPRQFSRLTSKCSMPNGATSIGRLAPVLSSTAQGSGAPRASAMRARSSTPMSRRSPTKRSPSSARSSASASQRLAASIRAPLSRCQLARPPPALTLRRQRHDAVLREDATDIGARGLAIRRRVEIDAAGARVRGHCRFRRRLGLRALLGPIAQFAQPLGQGGLQSAHFLDEVARGLAQIRPAPGDSRSPDRRTKSPASPGRARRAESPARRPYPSAARG